MRKIVRQLNEVERAILRPHYEAHRVYLAALRGIEPRATAPEVEYDPEGGYFYVEAAGSPAAPEPEPGQ